MGDKTPKQKKGVRRAAKAAGSPIPCGPTGGMDDMPSACGHMACIGGKCNVRYVGPVSHIRDHHVVHAARNSSHIWSAAIVTGLAVVLTGALGYAAFGAEYTNPSSSLYGEFQQINSRLDKIESMVKQLVDRCQLSSSCGTQPAQQPAQDQAQCKASCEAKVATLDYTQEQRDASVKACMEQNCPAPPAADSCTTQCKEKYKDDAAGVSACLKENCGTPTYVPPSNALNQTQTGTATPTTGGLAAPAAAGTSAEECLKKCYNDRVACFKEAGSNYTALRACVTKEASCKSACAK